MYKILLLIILLGGAVSVLLWLAAGGLLSQMSRCENHSLLYVRGVPINVEIADTPQERTQGLSGRDPLPDHHGLLFVFEEQNPHGFWMKNMKFPIDIIWFASDGRIVGIQEYASPESYPQVFYPDLPALYALEVNAGFVDTFSIQKGDYIDMPRTLFRKESPQQ